MTSVSEFPADPLSGRFCHLRVVMPGDVPELYRIATDVRLGYRWRFQGMLPSLEAFTSRLWDDVLTQCTVFKSAHPEIIGHVVAYSPDMRNGRVYFGIVMHPDMVGTGAGIEATGLFIAYLFANWPLRKIYIEVPDYVMNSYRSVVNYGFTQEAALREHIYHSGRHWDQLLFAIDRTTWTDMVAAFNARFTFRIEGQNSRPASA